MSYLFTFFLFSNLGGKFALNVNYRLSHFSTSTEATTTKETPPQNAQTRAQALLALLPGDTAFTKTAYATIGTGLGAFLISKGIYVPNDETLVLIAFAITMRALYNKLSGPVSEYLENSINVSFF